MPTGEQDTLADLVRAGLKLRIACRRCLHARVLDPGQLAEKLGEDHPARSAADRLICSKCGAKDFDVSLAGRNGEPLPGSPQSRAQRHTPTRRRRSSTSRIVETVIALILLIALIAYRLTWHHWRWF